MTNRLIREGSPEYVKVALNALVDSAEIRARAAKKFGTGAVLLGVNEVQLLVDLSRSALNRKRRRQKPRGKK